MTLAKIHRRPVARPHLETTVDLDGAFGWRVVAANGRALAVSVGVFADPAASQADFDELVGQRDLTREVTHPQGGVGWTWLAIGLDSRALACAPRMFERRATCLRSYQQFVETLHTFAPLAC